MWLTVGDSNVVGVSCSCENTQLAHSLTLFPSLFGASHYPTGCLTSTEHSGPWSPSLGKPARTPKGFLMTGRGVFYLLKIYKAVCKTRMELVSP